MKSFKKLLLAVSVSFCGESNTGVFNRFGTEPIPYPQSGRYHDPKLGIPKESLVNSSCVDLGGAHIQFDITDCTPQPNPHPHRMRGEGAQLRNFRIARTRVTVSWKGGFELKDLKEVFRKAEGKPAANGIMIKPASSARLDDGELTQSYFTKTKDRFARGFEFTPINHAFLDAPHRIAVRETYIEDGLIIDRRQKNRTVTPVTPEGPQYTVHTVYPKEGLKGDQYRGKLAPSSITSYSVGEPEESLDITALYELVPESGVYLHLPPVDIVEIDEVPGQNRRARIIGAPTLCQNGADLFVVIVRPEEELQMFPYPVRAGMTSRRYGFVPTDTVFIKQRPGKILIEFIIHKNEKVHPAERITPLTCLRRLLLLQGWLLDTLLKASYRQKSMEMMRTLERCFVKTALKEKPVPERPLSMLDIMHLIISFAFDRPKEIVVFDIRNGRDINRVYDKLPNERNASKLALMRKINEALITFDHNRFIYLTTRIRNLGSIRNILEFALPEFVISNLVASVFEE